MYAKMMVYTSIGSIGLNPIGDTGAECLAQALKENESESVKEI